MTALVEKMLGLGSGGDNLEVAPKAQRLTEEFFMISRSALS